MSKVKRKLSLSRKFRGKLQGVTTVVGREDETVTKTQYCMRAKQKIVNSRGPSDINLDIFV